MKKAILGKKLGMTQVFAADGRALPVTVVQAGPCVVVQKKTQEKDGYDAVKVGFGDVREKLLSKPVKGQFAKAGVGCRRYLRELKLIDYEVGQEIKSDVFAEGDIVDVSGVTRGKGTLGVIQRWNQHRGPMGHGSKSHRVNGSSGSGTTPGRVFKTKHMGGRTGHEMVTIQGLTIVRVDAQRDLLLVKGALPGPRGALLVIKETVKAAKK